MLTAYRVLLAALVVALPLTGLPSVATAAPLAGTVAVPGARIVAQQWLTPRTLRLTVETPSFRVPQPVEVTFPTGYARSTSRRWPVTY